MLAKGRLLGIQFDVLFTDDLYQTISKNAIETAAVLKKGLAEKGYSFFMDSPTNQVFIVLSNEQLAALEGKAKFGFWEKYDDTHKYPDQTIVHNAITATQEVLNQKKDNIALIDYLLKKEDDLFDQKDAMGNVETFFKSQIGTFDDAARLEHEMQADLDRIAQNAAAYDALNKIHSATFWAEVQLQAHSGTEWVDANGAYSP